jgi:hypothetical protein
MAGDSLGRDDRGRGGVHDFGVHPDELRIHPGVAVLVGLMDVDHGDVDGERLGRHVQLVRVRIGVDAQASLVDAEYVGAEPCLCRHERKVAGGRLEPADEDVLAGFLELDPAGLDGVAEARGEPEALEADETRDDLGHAACSNQPIDGHPVDDRDQFEAALLLSDQLTDEGHRCRVHRQAADCDRCPVRDELSRLLQSSNLAQPVLLRRCRSWLPTMRIYQTFGQLG